MIARQSRVVKREEIPFAFKNMAVGMVKMEWGRGEEVERI